MRGQITLKLCQLGAAFGAIALAGPLIFGGSTASASAAARISAANAHHAVYLVACPGERATPQGRPRIRPKEIVFTCADYGMLIRGAKWTNWHHATATATATYSQNNCIPDCAQGTFYSEPATVTVTRILKRKGIYTYSRLRMVPNAPNRYNYSTFSEHLPA